MKILTTWLVLVVGTLVASAQTSITVPAGTVITVSNGVLIVDKSMTNTPIAAGAVIINIWRATAVAAASTVSTGLPPTTTVVHDDRTATSRPVVTNTTPTAVVTPRPTVPVVQPGPLYGYSYPSQVFAPVSRDEIMWDLNQARRYNPIFRSDEAPSRYAPSGPQYIVPTYGYPGYPGMIPPPPMVPIGP